MRERAAESACLALATLALAATLASAAAADPLARVKLYPPATAPRSAAPEALAPSQDPRTLALADALRAALETLPRRPRSLAAAPTPDAAQREALEALERRSSSDVLLHLRPRVRTPRFLRGQPLAPAAPRGGPGPSRAERTARAFLQAQHRLLRLDDPEQELELRSRQRDRLGHVHLRFAQRYRGLEVWPAELLVHLDVQGRVALLTGSFVPTPRGVARTPRLSAEQALRRARERVPGAEAAAIPKPTLIVHAPGDTLPRLAWRTRVPLALHAEWWVVVDAQNGGILAAFDRVPTQAVVGSGVDLFGSQRTLQLWSESGRFWMTDTSKAMFDAGSDPPRPDTTRGAIIIQDAENQPASSNPTQIPPNTDVESSPSSAGGFDDDAVSAAFHFSEVYDYFLDVHGRNSLDGSGSSILAIVRLGQGFANAFFNPGLNLMGFGDALPFAGALDIVAHELTHGVTFHTSNLIYQNQSGALNESFSDIFGELVEAHVSGTTPDWRVGSALGTPLRDLADPGSLQFAPGQPYPERFGQFVVTSQDNGGVHINSSIVNHAFYQLAAGLPGAIGLGDAGRIFFRAFTLLLTASAQFIDARLACVQAAEELFGDGSEQALRTAEAFDRVEILAGPGSGGPGEFPGTSGEDATLFLFRSTSNDDCMPLAPALERTCLGRRESGDPPLGVPLALFEVAERRPVVVGDGSVAFFIDAFGDLCLIATDLSQVQEVCLGLPFPPDPENTPAIQVNSVAVSPDGNRFGFVLFDADLGRPDDRIRLIDLSTPEGEAIDFALESPALDGGNLATVLFADAMDLTANGRLLVYDAFNEISLAGGGSTVNAWSIYAIDLESGATLALLPPVPGVDIAFPSLSQRSDNFLTFDVRDTASGQHTIVATDLDRGQLVEVATNDIFGVPGYSGDDTAIVFSRGDNRVASGTSLVRQPLEADRITPTSDPPAAWLTDADFAVVYRRGDFVPEPGEALLLLVALGATLWLGRWRRGRQTLR